MSFIFTLDDLCLEFLENFKIIDDVKKEYKDFRITCFAISNFRNKEDLKNSDIFKNWFNKRKDWITIGVHSFDHMSPPDGDRKNEDYFIKKAYFNLKEYLPQNYSYRSAGWQTTNKTIKIIQELGFTYIYYQNKIKNIKEKKILNYQLLNSHLYDKNSLERFYEILQSYT